MNTKPELHSSQISEAYDFMSDIKESLNSALRALSQFEPTAPHVNFQIINDAADHAFDAANTLKLLGRMKVSAL